MVNSTEIKFSFLAWTSRPAVESSSHRTRASCTLPFCLLKTRIAILCASRRTDSTAQTVRVTNSNSRIIIISLYLLYILLLLRRTELPSGLAKTVLKMHLFGVRTNHPKFYNFRVPEFAYLKPVIGVRANHIISNVR